MAISFGKKSITAAALFATLLFACGSVNAQSTLHPLPHPAKWVVRVMTDTQGNPVFVEFRWPIARVGNIELVRVPWGYRHLLFGPTPGGQLTSNGHTPSLEEGHAGGLYAWAIMPFLTPHEGVRAPDALVRDTYSDLVAVRVMAVMNPRRPVWDRKAMEQGTAAILVRSLNAVPRYRDVPKVGKEGRFGLNRIGPARIVINPLTQDTPFRPGPAPYDDLWFDGQTPGSSQNLIECGSDERLDGTRDPQNVPERLCHHHFAHDGLNAMVRMTYRKKYLAQWRETAERATRLLDSFKTGIKAPEGP